MYILEKKPIDPKKNHGLTHVSKKNLDMEISQVYELLGADLVIYTFDRPLDVRTENPVELGCPIHDP